MIQKADTRLIIRRMPKLELHLHLEGAFTFDFLFQLIEKYGGDREIKSPEDLHKKMVFRDFAHFIELWFWKNQFFREAVDFEESTYHTLKALAQQNVIYAEVFYSPWDFVVNNLRVEEITEAVISGLQRAERDFPIQCNLIADLVRDYGAGSAIQRLDQITSFRKSRVIGIGLGGSEQKFPARDFAEVFREAKRRDFHLTAHAGEAAGPESVWEAINYLKIERIGHGVRAVEDPSLVEYLQVKKIPLEICVTSNLRTRVFRSLATHPLPQFYEKGLSVTIHSDDPTMFGSTITDELILLHEKMGFSLSALHELMQNAAGAAFLDEKSKATIRHHLTSFEISRNN